MQYLQQNIKNLKPKNNANGYRAAYITQYIVSYVTI